MCPDTRRHIGARTDDEVNGEAEADRGEDGAASDDSNEHKGDHEAPQSCGRHPLRRAEQVATLPG